MNIKEKILNKHGIYDGFSLHSNPKFIKETLYAAMDEYADLKVKELKENVNSGDKITVSESTEDGNGTKPMIGSCAFPDQSNFISESPSQTSIGSIKGAQKKKVCHEDNPDFYPCSPFGFPQKCNDCPCFY